MLLVSLLITKMRYYLKNWHHLRRKESSPLQFLNPATEIVE